MKKPELRVGSRVSVYGWVLVEGAAKHMWCDGFYLTITRITDDGIIEGYTDDGHTLSGIHVKQVRRLIKKKRRRVWIKTDDLPIAPYSDRVSVSAVKLLGKEFSEFVEVLNNRSG